MAWSHSASVLSLGLDHSFISPSVILSLQNLQALWEISRYCGTSSGIVEGTEVSWWVPLAPLVQIFIGHQNLQQHLARDRISALISEYTLYRAY